MTVSALHAAFEDFNRADAFFGHLAEDVVVEFPYGPTAGIAERVEGKAAVREHLSAVQAGGLRVHGVRIDAVSPARAFAEYTGTYRGAGGAVADVPLISVVEHGPEGIRLIREYWDTARLAALAPGTA